MSRTEFLGLEFRLVSNAQKQRLNAVDPSGRRLRSLVEHLAGNPPGADAYGYHRHLIDCLEEFAAAWDGVGIAEGAHLQAMQAFHRADFLELAEHSQARFCAAMVNYFHSGHAVLEAAAAYALLNHNEDPWTTWATAQEAAGSDPASRRLARVLTFRLREPRHLIAAHRRGWRVPVFLVGGGAASLARRPEQPPQAPAGLLERTRAAMAAAGMSPPRREDQLGLTAEVIARNADRATPELRLIFRRLVRTYGLQTEGVDEITPHVIELVRTVADVPDSERLAARDLYSVSFGLRLGLCSTSASCLRGSLPARLGPSR